MERTLNKELPSKIGQDASIAGWVDIRRDHGKLIFLDVRDRSGIVQVVVTPKAVEALETAKELRSQWAVRIEGQVKARPENMRSEGALGAYEFSAQKIDILSRAEVLPFELGTEVNIDTHLDLLPLTVRSERARDIFLMQETLIDGFRVGLRTQGFTEFQAPALVGGDAEGGAAAFSVDYYYEKKAYLATSPQFYKQIMVGAFERVFATPKVFRGEKHSTTRHLSEYSSMDFEMGFITDHRDVMAVLEKLIRGIVQRLSENHDYSGTPR